jgi:hypothetical protein
LSVEVLEGRLAPATLMVNSTADTASDSDPYLSLREAIALVNRASLPGDLSPQIQGQISGTLHSGAADTIAFDPAGVTGPIVLGGTQLELRLAGSTAAVTIEGGGGVTVDGANHSLVLMVDAGARLTLDHLALSHGRGGGSQNGGAILNAGTLTVTSSTLSANYSSNNGGGIYNIQGTLMVTSSTLSANSAGYEGGGIYNTLGSVTVSNSTLSANSATYGGGIENYSRGALTVTSSTLSANSAQYGGGIEAGGTLTVTNSTLSANSAQYGGGIEASGTVSLHNTLVAGNHVYSAGPDLYGPLRGTSSYTLVGVADSTLSGISNGLNGNLIGTTADPLDPRMGPLADNGGPTRTQALLADSPARGAGSLTFATATDQRGLPRTVGGEIDLGSFQTQSAVAGPRVVRSDPGGVTDPPVSQVRLTFNHPLDPTTFTPATAHLNGPAGSVPLTAVAVVPGSNGQEFDLTFGSQTQPGEYDLMVSTAVHDVYGNPLEDPSTRLFVVFGSAGCTLTVNSALDTANPSDPYLTLREAIAIVNSPSLPSGLSPQILGQISGPLHANGSDIIVFDPAGVTGPIRLGGHQLELSLPSGLARLAIDGGAGGVTLDGNNASRVLQVDAGGVLSLVHLTITHGRAPTSESGGGILNAGTLTVTSSTLSANVANGSLGSSGGGIHNTGTLTVSDSTLSANYATYGGGIENYPRGTLTVSNSTLSANYTYNNGAGIGNTGTLTVTNSTLSANSALSVGGGIYNYSGGTFSLQNTLLAGNHATSADPDIQGSVSSTSSYNLVGDGTGLSGISDGVNHNRVGTSASPIDPRLAPLDFYGGPTPTFALLPGGPALGAGDPSLADGTDQRGQLRAAGSIDIGAFQTQADPFVVTTLTDPGRLSGLLSLREAISLANVLPGDDTVSFADSLDGGAILLAAGQLELSDRSGVETIDGADRFTLDGGNATRLVQVDPATRAVVRGLALVNGNDPFGAGVYNQGSLTVADCVLYGNIGYIGGGVLNQGDLTVAGCTLAFNVATFGAAIDNQGMLTAYNSTILYNAALFAGGAIRNEPTGTAILTSLTISLNSADQGGGLDVEGGEVQLHNCIVAGNYSADASASSDIAGTVDPASTYNLIGTGGSGGLSNGVNHNLVGVSDPGLTTPDFSSPQTPVFGFTTTSPALGAGDPTLLADPVLRLDQHGHPRSNPPNIGAV